MKNNTVLLFIVSIAVLFSCKSNQPAGISTGQSARQIVLIRENILRGDGTLDEYLVTDWDAGYTRIEKQTRYLASGALAEKIEFSYDDNGLLIQKTFSGVDGQPQNQIEYRYNSEGKLLREFFQRSGAKALDISSTQYDYDNEGNCLRRLIRDAKGKELTRTNYTYRDGKLAFSETRAGGGLVSRTQYQYDDDGRELKQETRDAAKNLLQAVTTVWQDGREISSEQTGPDGEVIFRITSEYDANGDLRQKTAQTFQGEEYKQIWQFEYADKPVNRQSKKKEKVAK